MHLCSLCCNVEVFSLTEIIDICYRELSWIFIGLFFKETMHETYTVIPS